MLKDLLRVTIRNGKYTVVRRFNGTLEVLRHKQYWRDETGDNLILGLSQEVQTLRTTLNTIQDLHLLDPRDKEFEGVAGKIEYLLKEYESDEKDQDAM